MLHYQPTPTQEIRTSALSKSQVRLFMKREDLNHPFVSGNKWWKIKYNLQEAERLQRHTILTFGGAYSNHIYATAAAAHESGLRSIGIIRGEETTPLNATLQFAQTRGMKLHYVTRGAYRNKSDEAFIDNLRHHFGDFYLLPEGGSNEFAVRGVAEFALSLATEFDYLCCPVGTGGTLAGLVRGLGGRSKVLGFSALKNSDYLNSAVRNLEPEHTNWEINGDYHFGGYAKVTPVLKNFISEFNRQHEIPLENIYTGKMMAGIFDLVSTGFFEKGKTILAIHTGGVRGDTTR